MPNQPARSSSGKLWCRPERGGNSTSKGLFLSSSAFQSSSATQTCTVLPPGCFRIAKGRRAVDFPKPELDKVLGKRVPLFQEQAMQVAMVAAGFSATEADQLRRAMATFSNFTGGVNKFKDKLIQGMIDNGYDIEFANRTLRQLEGSYGCRPGYLHSGSSHRTHHREVAGFPVGCWPLTI